MENEDNTLDTQEEQQESEPVIEEITEVDEGYEPPTEAEVEAKVELSPAEYRHFKKWEKSKTEPPAKKVVTQPQKVSPQLNIEESILLANDVPEELIEELKLRAPKYGGSLIKAQKDPKYLAVKEQFDKTEKHKNASVGASRGSGGVKAKKDFNTQGLTREEHRKMVLDSNL